MVTIDPSGIITDANNAASTITGRPRNEIVGAPFMNFFDDPKKALQGVKKTFSEGSVRNYEMNLLVASNKAVPVSFNATLYRDSSGVVQGIFAIARST
jgi:PAS domain S-box-containing protein